MFGRSKEAGPVVAGPYLVESVDNRPKQLQETLNRRHAEGYDVVHVYQIEAFAASVQMRVVFRKRD